MSEGRAAPDPEHSIAPRRPRTLGGVVYLLALAVFAVGFAVVVLGHWRTGLTVMGSTMAWAAVARLVMRDSDAGMLGIRRKAVDTATLLGLGVSLMTLAAIIPTRGL